MFIHKKVEVLTVKKAADMPLQKSYMLPVFLIFLFISIVFFSCESETTDKNDPQNLQREEEREQQIKRERSDTTWRANPVYETSLEATNESKGDTEASGKVTLALQDDSVHIKGEFWGLTSGYTNSYIHKVLQDERVQRLQPELGSDKRSGTWESTYELDKDAVEMLKGDSLYISVYTTEYDNSGEISGQFTARDTLHENQ